jgi:hypothetical protein
MSHELDQEIDSTLKNFKFHIGTVDFQDGAGYQVVVYLAEKNLALCLSPEGARSMAYALTRCADELQPPMIELDDTEVD